MTIHEKIAELVKEIMQDGFDVAMGGDMNLSEEENKKLGEENYKLSLARHSHALHQLIIEFAEEIVPEEKTLLDMEGYPGNEPIKAMMVWNACRADIQAKIKTLMETK